MTETFLPMKYKGNRNYLHGSDFFQSINNVLFRQYGGWLKKIAFRGFAKKQCLLVSEKPSANDNIIATVDWQSKKGEMVAAWIIETGLAVEGQYDFDEAEISDLAKLENQHITLHNATPFTVIENVIALTKQLNYHLTPNVDGKWVFGQLNLHCPLPAKYDVISIHRATEIKNKFSRNRIYIDDVDLGEIRFIVGAP